MSRYVDRGARNELQTISDADMQKLVAYAKEQLILLKHQIQEWYQSLEKAYCVLEVAEDIVVTVCKAECSESYVCVGYPFSIYEEKVNMELIENCVTKLHMRSGELRRMQYGYFVKKLKTVYGNVAEFVVDDPDAFQQRYRAACNELATTGGGIRKAVFCDYNNFIGDSIISLELADFIKDQMQISELTILSNNKKHLSDYYPAEEYGTSGAEKCIREAEAIFFADFLDSHIALSAEIIEKYQPTGILVLLSRNLFVKVGEQTEVDKLLISDILLTNQGIHRYLKETYAPFIGRIVESEFQKNVTQRKLTSGGGSVFINIFSSKAEKEMPVTLAQKLVVMICEQTEFDIQLSKSVNGPYEQGKLANLLDGIPERYKTRIHFLCEAGLAALSAKIRESDIRWGITADTSVSHMLSRLEINSFTVYMRYFWDESSVLSWATESPLGYCGFSEYQLPVLYEQERENDIAKAIVELVKLEEFAEMGAYNKKAFYESDYCENIQAYRLLTENAEFRKALDTVFDVEKIQKTIPDEKEARYLLQNLFLICPQLKKYGKTKEN